MIGFCSAVVCRFVLASFIALVRGCLFFSLIGLRRNLAVLVSTMLGGVSSREGSGGLVLSMRR